MSFILFKIKLLLSYIGSQIWGSPISMLITCLGLFLINIAVFAVVYWLIFHWQNISAVSHDSKTYIGRLSPTPAFNFSESLKTTLMIDAINDLRLQKNADSISKAPWVSFSEDKSIYRQFGENPDTPDAIREISRLGLTPSQLIEKQFKKYGELKIEFRFNGTENGLSNINEMLIPIMMEYFREPSATAMSNRVINASPPMSVDELRLFSSLQRALEHLHKQVFQPQTTTLERLSTAIQESYSLLIENQNFPEIERLKNIFYGETLKALGKYNLEIIFDLNSLMMRPRFLDFVYTSTMVATNNVPSEIIPITDNVRFLIWIQMMISYFNLAIVVAVVAKILKLA
ncbi:hypothetical protein AZI87_16585 [Bdellovibrio bacteriovorus]|uniref:Uncharacterized protein n=1 Tax=Bdellovibrio bacteriovorus TaxID=959 RepID=A0A162FZQ4_BDEBC|nr:hypothetical protein [Bdellovibrio bacteriovorus]KYG62883.1 hypothetical protein AZI87_16585 [Bdellovibrio bacteriovorus]